MNDGRGALIDDMARGALAVEPRATCPSCGSEDTRPILELADVPVHSTRFLPSRAAALAIPRGRMELVWCRGCDFIANVAFDPAAIDYTVDGYEDSQAASATFMAFAHDLADHLVAQFDLHRGCVLEVGAGKGDFLSVLAERGDLAGIGVDPASPEAPPLRAGGRGRVHLRRQRLAPIHARIPMDLLCCRHTLEHVPDVVDFLRVVHGVVTARRVPVYLEVPDVARILDEGAFWDVYHEHCSYFCARSLDDLLDRSGFRVSDLRATFGGHYLSCEARPRTSADPSRDRLVPRPPSIEPSVARFVDSVDEVRTHWTRRIDEAIGRGARVVLWGAGSKAVGFVTAVPGAARVGAVVDIDPQKQGRFLPGSGLEVVAPDALIDIDPGLIIVLNPLYRAEITRQVEGLGVRAPVESV